MALCCSVLQCVAVCCSVQQCVAVCCSVLQCVASATQCVAHTYSGTCSRQRASCTECKGASICVHRRQRASCKKCNGTAICVHRYYKPNRKHCKRCDTKLVEGSEVETFVGIVDDDELVEDFVPIVYDI